MTSIWDNFRPGVLNKKQMTSLVSNGDIKIPGKQAIKASSLNLHLGSVGWNMKGSVKCLKDKDVMAGISKIRGDQFDLKEEVELKWPHTYLIELQEQVNLPIESKIAGQATGRSTVGRLDVLTRLLVSGNPRYDQVPFGYNRGSLYVEITPITFSIKVKEGVAISQLRLFKGKPELSELKGDVLELYGDILYSEEGEIIEYNTDIDCLSLNLSPTEIKLGSGHTAIGYAARGKSDLPAIDLSKPEKTYNPADYWEPLPADTEGWVCIERDRFYIFRSRERFNLPRDVAVYAQAVSENLGEIRIHYAGFAHPTFGHHEEKLKGTPLIFEVRGHNVDTYLRHREVLANIKFYKMSEEISEDDEKEVQDGDYQKQELKLSSYFKDWD